MWRFMWLLGHKVANMPQFPQNAKWTKLTDLSHINFDDLVKTNKFLQVISFQFD